MQMADLAHRRGITATHAGRTEHADLRRVRVRFEGIKQRLGSLELAGDRIADADGGGRRRGLAFLHHVEMGIKGCDLVDRCLRQAHLLTQRTQMAGRKMVVAVLDQMEKLDQQIGPARPGAEQFTHLAKRVTLNLPSLGKGPGALP